MQGKVSVGLSTVTGYGVSTAAFVGALLAYLGGDHSNTQLAIIGCGIIGALAFLTTQIGRYAQAKAAVPQHSVSQYLPGPGEDGPVQTAIHPPAPALFASSFRPGDVLPNELAGDVLSPADPEPEHADEGDAEQMEGAHV